MDIKQVVEGEAVVMTVSGCLDTAASGEFAKAVEGVAVGTKTVRFDFSGLEFIASSALRAMVTLGKRLAPGGGHIVVEGANDVVRDVFEMTGLVEVFEVR